MGKPRIRSPNKLKASYVTFELLKDYAPEQFAEASDPGMIYKLLICDEH